MKRRTLLKGIAGLPLGASVGPVYATRTTEGPSPASNSAEKDYNWLSYVMGVDIAPGELTYFAGHPDSGHTSLALDIALTHSIDRNAQAWFLTWPGLACRVADSLGIRLELIPTAGGPRLPFFRTIYKGFLGAEPEALPVTFIEVAELDDLDLRVLFESHPYLLARQPQLLLVHGFVIDPDRTNYDWGDYWTARFSAWRDDCKQLFDAAMFMTPHVNAGIEVSPREQRPARSVLRSVASDLMVADQVYFVRRRGRQDWTITQEYLAVSHARRDEILLGSRKRFLLIRDAASSRYRLLREDEALLEMGLGEGLA